MWFHCGFIYLFIFITVVTPKNTQGQEKADAANSANGEKTVDAANNSNGALKCAT